MTRPRQRAAARIAVTHRTRTVRVPPARLRELATFVAAAEGRRLGEIDLAVVGTEEIAALNRRYLGRAGATDVLSFDLSDEGQPDIAAQIVVCGDVAAAVGRALGHPARRELMLYVVHGLLHLMGYDDTTPRAADRMHAREEALLAGFCVRPPARRAKK